MNSQAEHQFTIRGETHRLSRAKVEDCMRGEEPNRISKYYVAVNGVNYPVKQVLAKCSSLQPIAFTSMDAYRVLHKLGFQILPPG